VSSRARRTSQDWRALLDLGEQLAAQPTVAAQRELIVQAAARLAQGRAELWLSGSLQWLLGGAGDLPVEPPHRLMQRAVRTRRAACGSLDGRARSAVALPLIAQGDLLGALQVERPAGPPFGRPEIALLAGLATQAAIALQSARQLAAGRWRVEQLSLVRAVSSQVANVLDLDELCRRVAELISRTFGYYYVALFTLETRQETLRCRAVAGAATTPTDGSACPIPLIRPGEGIIGHVAQSGVELLARNVDDEARYRHIEALPETRSEVALPLKIGDQLLGVLDVQSHLLDDFDETDLLVLGALADNIAIAIEHARLYGDLRRRADQLSVVAEVGRAVASILDQDALLHEVVTLIHEKFAYPFVHIFITDLARQQVVYRAGSGACHRSLQAAELAYPLADETNIIPWVARYGQTVVAHDVCADPRYRLSDGAPSITCAALDVPLIFGGRVLGVLDVRSDRPDAFGEDDRFLCAALADDVAVAIRNASLYRSELWRRRVADSLREAAGLLSADLALDELLDAILTELERILPCDAAAIWMLHGGELCMSAVHGYGAQMCVGEFSPDAAPWLHQALAADEPILRSPQSPPDPLAVAMGLPPDHSAIAAPLRVGEQRLGLLTLLHRGPGRYGTESEAMVAAFASYASVAIENTRLYRETQDKALVATVMLQVSEAIQSLPDLDEVLATVAHLLPMLVGVERCAILLWDEPARAFVPVAAAGLSPTQRPVFERWRVPAGQEPAFDDLRRNRTPVFVYDVATDSRLSGPDIWSLGFESLLLLPLLARQEVLGAIMLDYHGEWLMVGAGDPFRDERLAIIQGVAHQTAAAVENSKLREAQQEEAYVSAALLQVAQAVASLNDLGDILGVIVRITPILVGVERCAIFLWDEEGETFRPTAVYGLARPAETAFLSRRYAAGEFPLLDEVRQHDRPVVCSDSDRSARFPPDFVAHFVAPSTGEACRLLAVPLSVKGAVLGAMVLEEAEMAHRSRERRQEIITGIAHQAAMAVQNDRLQAEMAERERLEREFQLARQIQETFLPDELPQMPGWEVAALWRSAREVGGDLYDFFALPGGRLGVVIADVTDKGMPAALFMTLTRTLVRAAALEDLSPAVVLARVNDLLEPDAPHGMFVTLFYAVLDAANGRVIYSIAGHNPPYLFHWRTQELERLPTGGIALGVVEGVRFEDRPLVLAPGDYLILYTDGVTEAFSPDGTAYGEQRLQASIRSAAGGAAQEMLAAIDGAVTAFTDAPALSDDLTLVILRRAP